MDILAGITLKPGYTLSVSTQTANSFNIIVDAVNWVYPAVLPSDCCNYLQRAANTGIGVVSVGNPNVDGTGAIVPIITGGASIPTANGTIINAITIKAMQSTNDGMIRFFISDDAGSTYYLFKEVNIPQTNQAAFMQSYQTTLAETFYLEKDNIIAASTQNSENFSISIEGMDWDYPIS